MSDLLLNSIDQASIEANAAEKFMESNKTKHTTYSYRGSGDKKEMTSSRTTSKYNQKDVVDYHNKEMRVDSLVTGLTTFESAKGDAVSQMASSMDSND